MCDFQLATVSDIRGLVEKASSKSSSDIDVIHGTMHKSNIETLSPVLTRIINLSTMSLSVPAVTKHVIVTPQLKKNGLDPELLLNYRPNRCL